TYDDADRVKSVGNYVTNVTYDPDDRLRSLEYSNHVVETFSNDAQRRWVDGIELDGPAGMISQWTYGHTPDGQLKSEERAGQVTSKRTFDYDSAGRLKATQGTNPSAFAYDLAGNLTSDSGTTNHYDDPKHPDAVTSAGGTTFTYDAAGNLATRGADT